MMSTEPKDEVKEVKSQPAQSHTKVFLAFKQEIHLLENPEEKLKQVVDFMKNSLAQDGVPRFKDFWDAKNLCLPLFKEKISQASKELYWSKYTELATEAKRLKEILEEQSHFALEQIELALKGLSQEVSKIGEVSCKEEDFVKSELSSDIDLSYYAKASYEAKILLNLTFKLKSLREETIATEIRVRHKNRILTEISKLADEFIPRKKELIKGLSERFQVDVESFLESLKHDLSSSNEKKVSLQLLREKIKSFQDIAKQLPLNSHVFSKTRLALSCAWDLVKEKDKERKKEYAEKKEHFEALFKKIEESFKELKESSDLCEKSILALKQNLLTQSLDQDLSFHEKKELKAHIHTLSEEMLKPFSDKKAQLQMKAEQEKLIKAKELIDFKDQIKALLFDVNAADEADLEKMYQGMDEKIKMFSLSSKDKIDLGHLKRDLYESLLLKKENQIEEEEGLLESLLLKWNEVKEQTKARLELLRKEVSLSGFDFEKAMLFNESAVLEKNRLDRALQKVEELHDRL